MPFTRKTASVLEGLAIAVGTAALGHLAAPDVMPALIPAEYLPWALLALQLAQRLITNAAWRRNWNGSPAEVPAPPDPKELKRL